MHSFMMAFVNCSGMVHALRSGQGKRPRTSRPHFCVRATHGGAKTPSSLPFSWYERVIAPLDVELGAHTLRADTALGAERDHVFVDEAGGVLIIVDFGAAQSSVAAALLASLRVGVASNSALYAGQATHGLRALLASAIERVGAPTTGSVLLATTTAGVLRAAWVGPAGLLVVRDDRVAFRSYPRVPPRDALEMTLRTEDGNGKEKHRGASAGCGTSGTEIECGVDGVRSEFFALEDGDLIVAGSDGVFGNLSEMQILAFVRPVPDPLDTTLAIANNTCLGSWRSDDVHFISYYLAYLAENFATAENSAPFLPFPFPPSPHVDDISVIVGSCTFRAT